MFFIPKPIFSLGPEIFHYSCLFFLAGGSQSRDYPIWGCQFHPEKPAFEWSAKLSGLPHDRTAVWANGYLAGFFVDAARRSRNGFADREAEEDALFYNYQPQ